MNCRSAVVPQLVKGHKNRLSGWRFCKSLCLLAAYEKDEKDQKEEEKMTFLFLKLCKWTLINWTSGFCKNFYYKITEIII